MKDFFERLFGKKASAEGAENRPAAAEPKSSEESLQPYQNLGDKSAAQHIAHCRSLVAPDAERYFRLGSRYQQEGNNTEAVACYAKGLAIDPTNMVIWVNQGAALLALNRAAEAVACFDRAIALNPNDSGAWNNRGIALMSLGQREEGAACLLKALKMRQGGQE